MHPLSDEAIGYLLEVDPEDLSCLRRNESNSVEYKKSFGLKSLDIYARTLAGYANADGGYLVFGIDDTTKEILGLQNDHFDRLDPRILTEYLNSRFAPEIKWGSLLVHRDEFKIGVLYAYPAQNKPIIAISNGGRIREADIYFRYNGRTEHIKYPELRALLDEERRKEQAIWLKHLRRLATIGVDNAAVLSLSDGVASGKSGAFVIDSEILPQLQFIREGEFQEHIGAPTIRIIGDAEIVAVGQVEPARTQLRPVFISRTDIVKSFLEQSPTTEPLEYIRAICFEQTPYLPIYYFARLAAITIDDLLNLVENSQGNGKLLLLKRLQEDIGHSRYYQLPKSDIAASKRLKLVQQIQSQTLDLDNLESPSELFEAIQLLDTSSIEDSYILSILRRLFDEFSGVGGNVATLLRKAICHIDYIHNRHFLEVQESERATDS